MILNKQREKQVLAGLLAVLAAVTVYRIVTYEKPRTAPLVFPRGSVATSAVRTGTVQSATSADPITILLGKREEKYPGVARDLFRMENPALRPKTAPAAATEQPVTPPVPQKTPEELAAEAARADLSKFRFLGYVTDREASIFLSKDGELFIVKKGDTVQKSYVVKDAGKEYVILLDTATRVEVRVELSGGAEQPAKQSPGRPHPSAP